MKTEFPEYRLRQAISEAVDEMTTSIAMQRDNAFEKSWLHILFI